MFDEEIKRLAAAIFERVTAGRILSDGTTGTHSPHDAKASVDAAQAFIRTLSELERDAIEAAVDAQEAAETLARR